MFNYTNDGFLQQWFGFQTPHLMTSVG